MTRIAQPGGDQQGADLVAVQAHGVGLVVDSRAADMYGGRVDEQALFDGVAVETGDGAGPACDRCPRPTSSLESPGEALDVGAAHVGQLELVFVAPRDELAQVQGVGVAVRPL